MKMIEDEIHISMMVERLKDTALAKAMSYNFLFLNPFPNKLFDFTENICNILCLHSSLFKITENILTVIYAE